MPTSGTPPPASRKSSPAGLLVLNRDARVGLDGRALHRLTEDLSRLGRLRRPEPVRGARPQRPRTRHGDTDLDRRRSDWAATAGPSNAPGSGSPPAAASTAATGGGALLDAGVYPVALAHSLLGSPEHIQAQAHLTPEGVDEHTSVLLGYRSGATALLTCSFAATEPGRRHLRHTWTHRHPGEPLQPRRDRPPPRRSRTAALPRPAGRRTRLRPGSRRGDALPAVGRDRVAAGPPGRHARRHPHS